MSRIKTLNFENRNVIEVVVKPKSKNSSIIFDDEKKVYVVCVKSAAENGKANDEVLRLISKMSGKTSKIISGATSKKKLIKLE
jgi:uncharacterized protein (TIGR00251 family)